MSSSWPTRARAPRDTSVDDAEASRVPTGEEPQQAATPVNLSEASLAAVLLYGLTLDDEDPEIGVLLAARRELGLIANLAEATELGVNFDLTEMAPTLESIGRRLDVVYELILRARRGRGVVDPPAHEAPPFASTGNESVAAESLDPPGTKR